MTIQLESLLERNFALFAVNFKSNCSSEFLLVAGSERLDSKISPSKTRNTSVTSKDQKNFFGWDLKNGCSEKVENVKGKCRNIAPITLSCNWLCYNGTPSSAFSE